jgi:hypothetical protein
MTLRADIYFTTYILLRTYVSTGILRPGTAAGGHLPPGVAASLSTSSLLKARLAFVAKKQQLF